MGDKSHLRFTIKGDIDELEEWHEMFVRLAKCRPILIYSGTFSSGFWTSTLHVHFSSESVLVISSLAEKFLALQI